MIPAKNNASGADYNYRDNILSIQNSATVFYRLKMVDLDGQYRYSNVVNIKLPYRWILVVEGNPFRDELRLVYNSPSAQEVSISLYDGAGKAVRRQKQQLNAGLNRLILNNLKNLPEGPYIMEFCKRASAIKP